ncbi:MAG: stage 0 sporulation protein, partial [Paraclostridium sp.]
KVEDGKGKVIEINPLLEQVKIEFSDKNIKVYHREQVKVLQEPKKCGGCSHLKDEGLDEATLRELKKLED